MDPLLVEPLLTRLWTRDRGLPVLHSGSPRQDHEGDVRVRPAGEFRGLGTCQLTKLRVRFRCACVMPLVYKDKVNGQWLESGWPGALSEGSSSRQAGRAAGGH